MKRGELFNLIVETSYKLEQAEYDLNNTPATSATVSDCEDLTDKHQEALEYKWWKEEQIELIKSLKADLTKYKDQLKDLNIEEDDASDEFYEEESYADHYCRTSCNCCSREEHEEFDNDEDDNRPYVQECPKCHNNTLTNVGCTNCNYYFLR